MEDRSFRLRKVAPQDRLFGGFVAAVLMSICLMGLIELVGSRHSRTPAHRTRCRSNLRQIALACSMYADDNGERLPDRLEALYPEYADNAKVFSCPSCPSNWRDFKAGRVDADSSSYELVPGLSADMRGDTILAYDRQAANHQGRGRNAAFVDTHVEWLREDEFASRLAEQAERLRARAPVPDRPELADGR